MGSSFDLLGSRSFHKCYENGDRIEAVEPTPCPKCLERLMTRYPDKQYEDLISDLPQTAADAKCECYTKSHPSCSGQRKLGPGPGYANWHEIESHTIKRWYPATLKNTSTRYAKYCTVTYDNTRTGQCSTCNGRGKVAKVSKDYYFCPEEEKCRSCNGFGKIPIPQHLRGKTFVKRQNEIRKPECSTCKRRNYNNRNERLEVPCEKDECPKKTLFGRHPCGKECTKCGGSEAFLRYNGHCNARRNPHENKKECDASRPRTTGRKCKWMMPRSGTLVYLYKCIRHCTKCQKIVPHDIKKRNGYSPHCSNPKCDGTAIFEKHNFDKTDSAVKLTCRRKCPDCKGTGNGSVAQVEFVDTTLEARGFQCSVCKGMCRSCGSNWPEFCGCPPCQGYYCKMHRKSHQSRQREQAGFKLSDAVDNNIRIGDAIEVKYHPIDNEAGKWYSATYKGYDDRKKRHYVTYDDRRSLREAGLSSEELHIPKQTICRRATTEVFVKNTIRRLAEIFPSCPDCHGTGCVSGYFMSTSCGRCFATGRVRNLDA